MARTPNCKCQECGKEIYRRPFQLKKGMVFCSATCNNVRNKLHDIKCVVCGIIISRRKNAKTCSRTCSNINRVGTSYGQGRPNDNACKNKRLRERLFQSRPKQCNRCPFDKWEILHVHHIIERANGGTDDLSNLELLCPNCHYWHHYTENTKSINRFTMED
jgi:hypothetical protein